MHLMPVEWFINFDGRVSLHFANYMQIYGSSNTARSQYYDSYLAFLSAAIVIMNVNTDEPIEDLSANTGQEQTSQIVTLTKIATSVTSEENDRRAVRWRSRRERPRKLAPLILDDDDKSNNNGDAKHPRFDAIEPDIESFVTSCLPGVILPSPDSADYRSSKMMRKRSLPSMSFLSTTLR